MEWHFGSADGATQLTLREGIGQSYGHLIYGGQSIFVMGSSLKARSGSIPITGGGQQYSNGKPSGVIAPNISGELEQEGDTLSPTGLKLTGTAGQDTLSVELLPWMNRNIEAIVDAYRRSFAVFTIEGHGSEARCTDGWYGSPELKAVGGVIGLSDEIGFNYNEDTKNRRFSDDILNAICTLNPQGEAELKIPSLKGIAQHGSPVLVQFVGEAEHFADPPFSERHDQVANVFHEDYKRSCMTIEYSNSGGPAEFKFNEGRKKGHKSVIIIPSAF